MTDTRPNIWQLQSRRDVQGLIAALQYPDPEVRKRAAVALRTIDATQAVPALKVAFRAETDEQVQTHLSTTLHVLDHRTDVENLIHARDVEGLIKALSSRRPATIIAAANALGKLGNWLAVEPLVILFHNPASPPQVRLAAAEALLELKSAPAVVTLLGALRRDDWQVRRNAAAVLGQLQATWAVEPLAKALEDPHPVVRRTAAAALRRVGTADAVAALRGRFARQVTEPTTPQPAVPSHKSADPKPAADLAKRPAAVTPRPAQLARKPSTPAKPMFLPEEAAPVPSAPVVAIDALARPVPVPAQLPESPTPPAASTTAPAPSADAVQPAVSVERSSKIMQSVHKLIALFKQRNADDES